MFFKGFLSCDRDNLRRDTNTPVTLPFTLAEITNLDPNNENAMKAYMWVLHEFAPCVTGRKEWNENYLGKKVSDFLSKSDEAFMLVTLENQWNRWYDMFITTDTTSSNVHAPYTTMSADKTAGDGPRQPCRKFGGWNHFGMGDFQCIC